VTYAGPPPIDRASLERAAYAVLPTELAERTVRRFVEPGWFSFAPGLHPLALGLAAISDDFTDWLTSKVDSPREVRAIRALRAMPAEEAFERIRAQDWRSLGNEG